MIIKGRDCRTGEIEVNEDSAFGDGMRWKLDLRSEVPVSPPAPRHHHLHPPPHRHSVTGCTGTSPPSSLLSHSSSMEVKWASTFLG